MLAGKTFRFPKMSFEFQSVSSSSCCNWLSLIIYVNLEEREHWKKN